MLKTAGTLQPLSQTSRLDTARAAATDTAAELDAHIQRKLAALGASRDGLQNPVGVDEVKQLEQRLQLHAGGGIHARLQSFVRKVFGATGPSLEALQPDKALSLDRPGMAVALSLPENGSEFSNAWVTSKRLRADQGILNNPHMDRRKTDGTFHVTDYGQLVPDDKKAVPIGVSSVLLQRALTPPDDVTTVPFTKDWAKPLRAFTTLYLRPTVLPKVPGIQERESMEIMVATPGNFISNSDFLERVFGHGGDPRSLLQDAALDPKHWSGHSGLIVFAPQLVGITKKEIGLPEKSTLDPSNPVHARLIRDGMCWSDPKEKYNEGEPFKITTRGPEGVIVDVIADNYYGYGKKTVKAHLSYAANLRGMAEEEHAGGAIAYARYDLGENFTAAHGRPAVHTRGPAGKNSFAEAVRLVGPEFELRPQGYAVHKDRAVALLPDDFKVSLNNRSIVWMNDDTEVKIPLVPNTEYFLPSGYRITFEKGAATGVWRLIGTAPEGVYCHKPFTVSGGGKSEIAKPLISIISVQPLAVEQFSTDLDRVKELVNYDYSQRFKDHSKFDDRPLLSPERTLGSVVKLLTPSDEYTADYNQFLAEIKPQVRDWVQYLKRVHTEELGDDWAKAFSVNTLNGKEGRLLQFRGKPVTIKCLRVGYFENGQPREFVLRDDFISSAKLPREDDITASSIRGGRRYAEDVEKEHFQRPDGAKNHEDPPTDNKFGGRQGLFISNYEPLTRKQLLEIVGDPINFERYTSKMQEYLLSLLDSPETGEPFVAPDRARLVADAQGRKKPSSNPRFLEVRADIENPDAELLGRIATKLSGHIPFEQEIANPVDSILMGRRLNKPEPGIPSLAVYNPIHYQELPELFMDLIPSITGKGPSTIGFGKERALTKGPFNALPGIVDLNNAFVGLVVSDGQVFSTAAGFVGPKFEVEHDVSMLIPELWSRMNPAERNAKRMINEGLLEPVKDIEHGGEVLAATRLGYRMTEKFSRLIGGRVFEDPDAVFPETWLKPELQNMDVYAEGVRAILKAQKEGAEECFRDGTVELAVPPLKALLHIMRDGKYDTEIGGEKVTLTASDPRFRAMFEKENVLKSDWYQARLNAQHARDIRAAEGSAIPLENLMAAEEFEALPQTTRDLIGVRAAEAHQHRDTVRRGDYVDTLKGGIGLDPAASAPRAAA